ncbi:MAG: hypothetical protein GY696_04300, partial [Gammaproteobacteria bacterium]|nr:hypothetical protein [Gammaproteobacteria bacterium]
MAERMGRCYGPAVYINFLRTTAANVLTILVAAVKAGPRVAADVGRRLYNHHRHAFRTTMQEHQNNRVSKSGAGVNLD